ncbi:MAG: putative zinc-binding metallopeptidase [Gammaproteobacteria bacterium]
MTVPQKTNKAATKALQHWVRWPKDKLLDMRICDLGLRIAGSPLEPRIEQLYRDLEQRDFEFRPHFWLSDEWYCPDGVPGVAVPFFLSHPRLRRLELESIMEVEGGTRDWCMRLLRHETAHALLNAYRLQERRDWKQIFGRPTTPYPDTYLPKPYSKRYVLNLPNWYAQAHPHEDWAETFAVWLRPKSDWRRRYRQWPAIKKLEYVDALMHEIRGNRPRLRNLREEYPVEKIRTTLRAYYIGKIARYGHDSPEFFDRDLKKLFSCEPEHGRNEKASRYIRRTRGDIIDVVERWTGEYKYRINEVLKEMVRRCEKLGLRVARDEQEMKPEMVGFLTMVVMHKLYSGGFRINL